MTLRSKVPRTCIDAFQVTEGTLPAPPELARSNEPRPERPIALIRLSSSGRAVGWGELSPLPGYSDTAPWGDTKNALQWALSQLIPWELGDDQDPVARLDGALSRLGVLPSARFAIETAFLDAAAREAQRPLREVLASGRETIGEVAINHLLPALDTPAERLVSAVARGLDCGVTTFKAKVGRVPIEAELSALEMLRRIYGTRITLRLDANASWSPDEATEQLSRFAPLAPEYVEQPVGRSALIDYIAGTAAPLPLAADESLQDPGALEKLLAAGCRFFVLKPAAVGGLIAASKMARTALAEGAGCVVTHLMDGPVAIAAACELALAFGTRLLPCGLAEHSQLALWHKTPPQLRADRVALTDHAGLGLSDVEIPR